MFTDKENKIPTILKIYDCWLAFLTLHFVLFCFNAPPLWGDLPDGPSARALGLVMLHLLTFVALLFVCMENDKPQYMRRYAYLPFIWL
jgi:hypothetical protein